MTCKMGFALSTGVSTKISNSWVASPCSSPTGENCTLAPGMSVLYIRCEERQLTQGIVDSDTFLYIVVMFEGDSVVLQIDMQQSIVASVLWTRLITSYVEIPMDEEHIGAAFEASA
jgi:hypothetical protein